MRSWTTFPAAAVILGTAPVVAFALTASSSANAGGSSLILASDRAIAGWTGVAANLAIFGACTGMAIILHRHNRRRDVATAPFLRLFAALVLALGVAHLLDATNQWWPTPVVSGVVTPLTALATCAGALAMMRLAADRALAPVAQTTTGEPGASRADVNAADERFRLVVEHSPNANILVDSEGLIVLLNERAERLLGYARGELLGKPVETIVPTSLATAHMQMRGAFMERPEPREMGAGRDLHAQRKDGTLVPVEVGLNPVVTPEGMFVLSVVVDISERKAAERELARRADIMRQQNEELRRRNSELDEFTYVASHDLQEPLRKVVSFARLLPRDLGADLSERAQQDLHFITDAAMRMQTLIQDLLVLSRAGRADVDEVDVDLGDALNDAIEALETQIQDAGAVIEVDDLPTVSGDRRLLTQLFQNLISNAIKFRKPDTTPRVYVTADSTAAGWTVTVRDNGIGIEEKYAQVVFAPFKRLHGRGEYPGSGIGLSICRKVAERHGGTIWVEPNPEGAVIKVTIKRVAHAEPRPTRGHTVGG